MKKLQTIQPLIGRTYIIARAQDLKMDNNPKYLFDIKFPDGSSSYYTWEELIDESVEIPYAKNFTIFQELE